MDKKLGKYSLDIINGMIDWVRVIDPDHRIVFHEQGNEGPGG